MLQVEKFNLNVQETRSRILGKMKEEPSNQALMKKKLTVRDIEGRENTIGTTVGRVVE